MSCVSVEPSASRYVPVATNCCVPGLATVGLAGVTTIFCNTGPAVTVNVAVAGAVPVYVAVMVADPAATAVAIGPFMVATAVLDEVQVAIVDTSTVLPSE